LAVGFISKVIRLLMSKFDYLMCILYDM
jgi:hypothetical protein